MTAIATGPRMTASEVAAYVQQHAPNYNLDPAAVMAAAQSEGLGGGIGDGGHAYGPWQDHLTDFAGRPWYGGGINNANAQAWAWSAPGVDYALQQMASAGAAGLQSNAAVVAIQTNYERSADIPGQIRKALDFLGSWQAFFGQGAQIPGVTTPGVVRPSDGTTDIPPQVQAAPQVQAGSFVSAMQTLVGGWLGPGLKTLNINPDMSGLILLLASIFAILIGAIIWNGEGVKREAPNAAKAFVLA